MRNLISVVISAVNFLRAKYAPVEYAKSIGVNVGNNVRMLHPRAFGSEPYSVELGDGLVVPAHVRFITHDGSTFVSVKDFPTSM